MLDIPRNTPQMHPYHSVPAAIFKPIRAIPAIRKQTKLNKIQSSIYKIRPHRETPAALFLMSRIRFQGRAAIVNSVQRRLFG
jgi:hypothetical protein